MQLSQARRHLTEEWNPSLQRGIGTRKNELRDAEKERADQTIMEDYLVGGKIKTDIHRCKGLLYHQKLYLVINTYLVVFYVHIEVMDQMLILTLTHDG